MGIIYNRIYDDRRGPPCSLSLYTHKPAERSRENSVRNIRACDQVNFLQLARATKLLVFGNTLDIQTPPEIRYLDPKNIPKTPNLRMYLDV